MIPRNRMKVILSLKISNEISKYYIRVRWLKYKFSQNLGKILNIAHADNRLGKYMIVTQGKSWISIRGACGT